MTTNFDNPTQTVYVKEGASITAVFNVVSEREISSVTRTCGCYNVKWDAKSISLSYNVGSIPQHLAVVGRSEFNKGAEVTFSDGTTERVSIKGVVTR